MIKERLGSMMALLLKLDMTEDLDATTSLRGILAGACGACASRATALADATTEIQLNREANDSLSQTIQSYTASKEEFQNDFFKKMCLVLNSKKREVRRLQEEVSSLEDEISSLKAKATKATKCATKGKGKAKPASKSKPKKPKVVKRDESEDDDDDDEEEEESDGHDECSIPSDDDEENTSQGAVSSMLLNEQFFVLFGLCYSIE